MSFLLLGAGASRGEYALLTRNQCQQSSLWSAEITPNLWGQLVFP